MAILATPISSVNHPSHHRRHHRLALVYLHCACYLTVLPWHWNDYLWISARQRHSANDSTKISMPGSHWRLPVSQKELGKPWRKATFRFRSVDHWWGQGLPFVSRVSRAHGYFPPLSGEKAQGWNVSTDGSNHSAHSQISITKTTWRSKTYSNGQRGKKNKLQRMGAQNKFNKPELQLPTDASWFCLFVFPFCLKIFKSRAREQIKTYMMKYVKICNRN